LGSFVVYGTLTKIIFDKKKIVSKLNSLKNMAYVTRAITQVVTNKKGFGGGRSVKVFWAMY